MVVNIAKPKEAAKIELRTPIKSSDNPMMMKNMIFIQNESTFNVTYIF